MRRDAGEGSRRHRYKHFISYLLISSVTVWFVNKLFPALNDGIYGDISYNPFVQCMKKLGENMLNSSRVMKKCFQAEDLKNIRRKETKFISNWHEIWTRYNYHPFLIALSYITRLCAVLCSFYRFKPRINSKEQSTLVLVASIACTVEWKPGNVQAKAREREMERERERQTERCSSFRMFVEGFRLL